MERRNQNKERRGDTSRTSSQGRKLSSGGDINKKGSPEIDESAKSVKTEMKIRAQKPGKRQL